MVKLELSHQHYKNNGVCDVNCVILSGQEKGEPFGFFLLLWLVENFQHDLENFILSFMWLWFTHFETVKLVELT